MKVSLGTIEVSPRERAALAHHYGQTSLATRDQMRRFILDNGSTALEDICEDYDNSERLLRNALDAS